MRDLRTGTFTHRNVEAASRLLAIILLGCSIVGCNGSEEMVVEVAPAVDEVVLTAEPTSEPTAPPPTATPAPAAYSGNIVDLQEQGQLEIRAQGSQIEELTLQLQNLTGDSLDVDIPAGTYFISGDSAMQNMVVRHGQTIRLTDQDWRTVELEVACANIDLEVPGSETGFEIVRSPVQADLEQLMPILEQAGVIYDVEQAAIWIVTDNADLEELGTLVRTSLGNPFGSRVIGYDDAAYAMQLVDEAGINIRRRAIWSDRYDIAAGVEDPLLAEWIDQRASQAGPGGEEPSDVVALLTFHPVIGAAFVPNAQQVVTSICLTGNSPRTCRVGEKQVWDSVTGELLRTFGNQPSGQSNLVFAQDGSLMATAACGEYDDDYWCLDSFVQLWDTESWAVAGVLRGHPDRIEAIAFSPDGSVVASKVCVTRVDGLCTSSQIWLWDVATREVVLSYTGFLQFANSLAFSPDGQLLAAPICAVPGGEAYCQASEIWVWDAATGALIQQLPLDASWRIATVFTADGDGLAAVGRLLDDETSLATWLWRTDSWELVSRVPIDEGELYTCSEVAFAPVGEVAAVGQCGVDEEGALTSSNVLIWDLRSGAPISRIDTYEEFIMEVGISSDGAQVLVTAFPRPQDNRVMVWPVE
jgi:WD40 repeat protein